MKLKSIASIVGLVGMSFLTFSCEDTLTSEENLVDTLDTETEELLVDYFEVQNYLETLRFNAQERLGTFEGEQVVDSNARIATEDTNEEEEENDDKWDFLGDCVVVEEGTEGDYKTISFDYGDGCTFGKYDEWVISGKFTDKFGKVDDERYHKTTFENYKVNDVEVDGFSEVVGTSIFPEKEEDMDDEMEANTRKGADHKPRKHHRPLSFTVNHTDELTISFPADEDEGTEAWSETIEANIGKSGDQISEKTGGNVTYSNTLGKSFSIVIKDSIVRSFECENPVRIPIGGVEEVTVDGVVTTVNYGDGVTCDYIIEVTKDGETMTVDLSEKFQGKQNKKRHHPESMKEDGEEDEEEEEEGDDDESEA